MSASVTAVRAARESDLDAVLEIERASFSDPWSRESFESALELGRMLFVIAEGAPEATGPDTEPGRQELLGYAIVLLLFDEAEVADLAVAPAARGRGIGGLLLDAVTAEVRVVGVRSLYLEVRESNVWARALYDSRSFAHVGRRRGYYASPREDALVMRRDL